MIKLKCISLQYQIDIYINFYANEEAIESRYDLHRIQELFRSQRL